MCRKFLFFCFEPVARKYKGQHELETKFLTSFTHIRFAICSKKQFRTEDIETIVECFSSKFEKYALSKLGWLSKLDIENGRTTSDFPFSVVSVYSKSTGAGESRDRNIQFIMDDFSFEQRFYNNFKFLRENKKVMLSFNIDCCLSILNDKITISFYYDDASLDVENEMSRLDKSAAKFKLNKQGLQILCKIVTYRSIFYPGSVLFDRDFAYVTAFEFR